MSFGRHALRLTDHQWVWMVFANPSMVKYGKIICFYHMDIVDGLSSGIPYSIQR